ncbi:putative arabinan endo-1,5-alpha-L-arabinosidase A [Phytophthora rubi]|uniref:arabinan endo-1,5-alpha-L-arabinosidase n=2 Tax=Phytophthora rubi TaxID=129364 RepID=A0A6A3HWP4_9STRA|nr:putative arabinan endo-1,5-alpha-L-arabinosidase A [Phytophthora rubi]KAE9284730.1 putative arabinan endo-1,5-alpha-L-arabinosidase A [Phytophthora rubi]
MRPAKFAAAHGTFKFDRNNVQGKSIRTMKLLSILVGLPLLVAGLVNGYANPQTCTGVCTNAHDPSIIRHDDGTYFRFSTGNKIAVHSAPALTGPWTYRGAAVPNGSKINLKGKDDLWAPEVNKIGDTYYLYYSVSSFGGQNSTIGLTQSKTMEPGSWVDAGSVGVTSDSSKPYNAIDPNLIQVGGQYYLNFGSYWQGLHQTKMTSPAKAGGGSASQIAFTSNYEVVEAAFEFAYNGYYYLFFSKGSCCKYDKTRPAKGKEYRILVCRSKSPTSGFVDKNGADCRNNGGSVVLESHDWVYGPGGQGVFKDPKYGPVLYYHYVDTRIGYADGDKRFGWNQLDFSSGWPKV